MTESTHTEAIRYRNEEFAINHLIDDCPPQTVIRELLKNAEENASLHSPPGRIEWFVEEVRGVPKLGLFNEGPGMTAADLSRLMDLASTGKKLGVDNNFGQGGKISALKSSPHGVIYRSCKNGRVSQMLLAAEQRPGLDFPVYVKKVLSSQEHGSPNRPLDREWTEVVLLGTSAMHNTVNELFPSMATKNWLMRMHNTRFFRFADGVVIHGVNLTTGSETYRNALGLEKLAANHSEKQTDVAIKESHLGPLTIRYCRLRGRYGEDDAGNSRAKTMDAYGLGSRGDHICLVWKNECYDIHAGWARISGAFGVTFGSSNVAIEILIPDNAPVKNNTYRDAIIERSRNHRLIQVEDFADLVRRNRPKWLVDYIDKESRKNTSQGDVTKRLKALLDALRAPAENRHEAKPGDEGDQGEVVRKTISSGKSGKASETSATVDKRPNRKTQPGNGQRSPAVCPGVPQVSFAEDPAILEEMVGRAGMYKREENAILLNPHHFKYKEDLNKIFRDVGPGADRRSLAKHLFDQEYCYNAGKFVVLAWLFKGKAHWGDRDWEQALNMFSLSVLLAEPASLDFVRKRLRQKLNSRKMNA